RREGIGGGSPLQPQVERGCDRDSGRLQGRAPPAGRGSAAGVRFSRRLSGGATATAGAFRDVPRPQGGDRRRESASADSRFAKKRSGEGGIRTLEAGITPPN